jgi:L-fuculose-phosphate aldolase
MEYRLRKEMIQFSKLLYNRGFLNAADGNLSVRCGDMFLTTPSGRNKGLISENDLVLVDKQGKSYNKSKKPSSEFLMHLKVYEERTDVNAVVHCHPTFCTVYASSQMELNQSLLTESVVLLGAIPKANLALPSTEQVPESIAPYVGQTDCILLANHGSLTYGGSLEEAFNKMETLEHYAKVSYLTNLMGKPSEIDMHNVKLLENLRPKYGLKNPVMSCSSVNKDNLTSENIEEIVGLVLESIRGMN